MRVRVKVTSGRYDDAVMLGLLRDEHGDVMIVIRRDGCGLILDTVHPSYVNFVGCTDD